VDIRWPDPPDATVETDRCVDFPKMQRGGLKLPTAITQEGGYNVDVIGDLLEGFLKAWGDAA
ncbi:MAG: hypothetical protein LW837_11425, partial [Roseomonas sp.]|nr:hypothetical protein [Roseomonas sp.]